MRLNPNCCFSSFTLLFSPFWTLLPLANISQISTFSKFLWTFQNTCKFRCVNFELIFFLSFSCFAFFLFFLKHNFVNTVFFLALSWLPVLLSSKTEEDESCNLVLPFTFVLCPSYLLYSLRD